MRISYSTTCTLYFYNLKLKIVIQLKSAFKNFNKMKSEREIYAQIYIFYDGTEVGINMVLSICNWPHPFR